MEQEKILPLILSKLDNIEKEQQEMKKEIFVKLDKVEGRLDKVEVKLDKVEGRLDKVEVKLDRVEGRLDKVEVKLDRVEGRLDKVEVKLDKVEGRLDKLQNGQESIRKFILNSEIAFEKFQKDHIFIEKLKKVAGE